MANRFPLVVDSSALQIKEIPANDNLDLANNSIVNVVNITASGNVSVGGTLTYEDVENIDSVGLITARTGIKIGPSAGVGGTFSANGSYITAGIITAGSFNGSLAASNLTGALPAIDGSHAIRRPAAVVGQSAGRVAAVLPVSPSKIGRYLADAPHGFAPGVCST